MGSVLLAVEVASALADAIQHMLTMQQAVHKLLAEADANGGKLSPDQIIQLVDMRHQAVAALDAAVAKQTGGGS